MKIEYGLIAAMALSFLASGASWGEINAADATKSGQHAAQRGKAQPTKARQQATQKGNLANARPVASSSASTPSRHTGYAPRRGVTASSLAATAMPSAVDAASSASAAVPTSAVPMQNPRAMTTPHFTPNSPRPNTLTGVLGHSMGHHAPGLAVVGGPGSTLPKKVR